MGIHVSSLGPGKLVSNPCFLSNCWHDRCKALCPTVFENIKRRLSRLPESKGDARPSQKGYLVTPTPPLPTAPGTIFSSPFPGLPLSARPICVHPAAKVVLVDPDEDAPFTRSRQLVTCLRSIFASNDEGQMPFSANAATSWQILHAPLKNRAVQKLPHALGREWGTPNLGILIRVISEIRGWRFSF